MADTNQISVVVEDHVVIVTFSGSELDYDASSRLRTQIIGAVQENSQLPVIVDLAGVMMLPSVSIGALIQACQLVRGNQQRFLLTGLSDAVKETLRICRLDRLFELQETREAALSALGV